jgi:hypothetical protein
MLTRLTGAGVLEDFLSLEEGETQRVVIDHSDDLEFACANSPHITLEGGGAVILLDVAATNGGQFALICKRSEVIEYPSGEDNDLSYTWDRVGIAK